MSILERWCEVLASNIAHDCKMDGNVQSLKTDVQIYMAFNTLRVLERWCEVLALNSDCKCVTVQMYMLVYI